MRLLLIAPASGRWQHLGSTGLYRGRAFRFSLLSLLTVAAVTPEDWEVILLDEQVEEVPADISVDLVGITCMTALAPRAYEIAAQFRARGIPVVLGGMHPSLLPEEALGHADAVVAGDVEGVWHHVLEDAKAHRLHGIYRSDPEPSLANLRPVPRHLMRSGKYATVQAVQATRGCPRKCGFCSIAAYSHSMQRKRPVASVAAEIAALPGRFLVFVDDNLTADREYAMALFRALEPLNKLWITQAELRCAEDTELVEAAARAGCFGIFAGIETFSQEVLKGVCKGFNRVDRYRELISKLHRHGIGVEAGIVFGLDGHTPEVFADTLAATEEMRIDAVQVSIATPLPGTRLYQEWADRIIDRDWAHYDLHNVVFQPSGMSVGDLQAGHDWMTAQFYSPWRVARRMERWMGRPRAWQTVSYAAGLNFGYAGRVRRWGLKGYDPARRNGCAAPSRAGLLPSP